MVKLIVTRIAFGALTLLIVSMLVFAATQALPGDAAVIRAGKLNDPARLAAYREQLHLDEPMVSQYVHWLGDIVQGRLGNSLANDVAVSSIIGDRIGYSLLLMLLAGVMGITLALALGAAGAIRRDRLSDHVSSGVMLAVAALPEFVIGIGMVILLAANVFHVFPAVSIIDPSRSVWGQLDLVLLPAITLALAITPYIARIFRGSMVEVLESEYVAMARLKGLRERRVILTHAFRNAAGPLLQVVAISLGYLAGGVVIVENVFQYPGIGQALVTAVSNRDVPTIQALTLMIATVYVVVNIAADVLTVAVTPRLRTEAS